MEMEENSFEGKVKKIQELYDKVPYQSYGSDFSTIFKSLSASVSSFNFQNCDAAEIGCGAGHITLFLSQYFRKVIGFDLSDKSLDIAREKLAQSGRNNVEFQQANLFDENFIKANAEKFDYVLCYGVLHHTPDPEEGFSRLLKIVKPGGILCVGLYSRTEILYRLKRQIILWLAGDSEEKRNFWAKQLFYRQSPDRLRISDGYANPVVSFHSPGEVLRWITGNKAQFLGCYPPLNLGYYFQRLRGQKDNTLGHFFSKGYRFLPLIELLWIFSGKSVMINISCRKI